MEIQKELNSISLPITEAQYRAMPELSYSTLSTYESLGYNGLDHLFDKKETSSLTFGSAVDTILTGGEEEFNTQFFVADYPSIGEKELQIVNYLFQNYAQTYESLSSIPATYILDAVNTFEFQKNWKEDTRVRVITERCGQYYDLKQSAGTKTLLDLSTFNDVKACVRALRESPATGGYFAADDELTPIRRYFQLKFKAVLKNVGYRCMADLIVVDYENKKIYPIDLKTSSTPEWDFEKSFCKWHYYIQARLYWRIIRNNLDRDAYFKDFSLEDYRFVVINRKTLTPLVWEFPLTKTFGTLIDDTGIEIRDPFEIGTELRGYLDCRPPVPNGISTDGPNIINCLKVKGV